VDGAAVFAGGAWDAGAAGGALGAGRADHLAAVDDIAGAQHQHQVSVLQHLREVNASAVLAVVAVQAITTIKAISARAAHLTALTTRTLIALWTLGANNTRRQADAKHAIIRCHQRETFGVHLADVTDSTALHFL
jgi:hypothetical protein